MLCEPLTPPQWRFAVVAGRLHLRVVGTALRGAGGLCERLCLTAVLVVATPEALVVAHTALFVVVLDVYAHRLS
jgi:hypothetical protein